MQSGFPDPAAIAAGFAFGLGLILSIGPQNLMLIRAGLARNHPMVVASTGYVSEVLLVALGIGGLGALLAANPAVSSLLQALSAVFLAWCGLRILVKVGRERKTHALEAGGVPLTRAVGAMLVVTWLNPLAWLEAMFLVGVLSSGHEAIGFATGFLLASAIKFYGWSLAGMTLSRHLGNARCLACMDAVAGVVLIAVAALLGGGFLA